MSIPIYVLAGFDRRKLRSNESALKYFLIGSFASALLLYGMALLYGATGHAPRSPASAHALRRRQPARGRRARPRDRRLRVQDLGGARSTSGRPTSTRARPRPSPPSCRVTVKTAAFAALLRLVALAFGAARPDAARSVLWVLAALTMMVGNVMAVIQDNVKRLLAYSSIAHAGYLLIGFVHRHGRGLLGGGLLPGRLPVHEPRRLRAWWWRSRSRGQDCERMEAFAGLAQRRPGPRGADDALHALARRHPGHGRLHRASSLIFAAAVDAGVIWLTILGAARRASSRSTTTCACRC